MRRIATITCFIVLIIIDGCSAGDEGAVRTAVRNVFDAAQRGDVAFALDLMDASGPVSAALQALRAERGEEAYDLALAGLGERARAALEGWKLRIESVNIAGDRAMAECVLEKGEESQSAEIVVNRIGGEWRPYAAPGMPVR